MKTKLSLLVFAICFLLSFQCFAQDNVIRLKAPEEVTRLWEKWNGKYVMYVHKEANVKTFKDIDGMSLMVALIESPDEIIEDASSFRKKSGFKLMIGMQNNPSMFDSQFLGSTGDIGMMVPKVAKHYTFDKNAKLARLEFE